MTCKYVWYTDVAAKVMDRCITETRVGDSDEGIRKYNYEFLDDMRIQPKEYVIV